MMTYTCRLLYNDLVPVACYYECDVENLSRCLTRYQPQCCAVEHRGEDSQKLLSIQCNSCDIEKGRTDIDFLPAQKLEYKHINMTEFKTSHTAAVVMAGEDNSGCPKLQCAIPLSFFAGIFFVGVIVCLAKNACRDGPGQVGECHTPTPSTVDYFSHNGINIVLM